MKKTAAGLGFLLSGTLLYLGASMAGSFNPKFPVITYHKL